MLDKVTKKRLAKKVAERSSIKNKLTEEERDDVARRYANNETVQSIAAHYGVSLVTIYYWIGVAAKRSKQ